MGKMSDWYLVFGNKAPEIYENSSCIKIKSTRSNWNDFSFNFRALLDFVPNDDRKSITISAFIVPWVGDERNRLDKWIESNTEFINKKIVGANFPIIVDGNHGFNCLFNSEDEYRKLHEWANSKDEIIEILSKLNDIAMLRNSENSHDFNAILFSDEFKLGVLRSPSAYRALRRGWRCVLGQEIEAIKESRHDFKFSAKLHGFDDGNHDLNIGFHDIPLFEDRIHCLIGVNGTGKTRLLREFIIKLGGMYDDNPSGKKVFPDDKSDSIAECEYEGLPYNRVLVFSADNIHRYPIENANESQFEYQYFNLTVGFERVYDSEFDKDETLTAAIVDLMRNSVGSNFEIDGEDLTRFRFFKMALRDHLDLDCLYLPVIGMAGKLNHHFKIDSSGRHWVQAFDIVACGEQRKLELLAHIDILNPESFFVQSEDGNGIRPFHLSSGQRMFFRFALKLINSIDIGSLLIIDEPETHLHPKLICDFMSVLYDVLRASKSIALIATHSTYVVREVPSHCVHVMVKEVDSEKVRIGHVRLKTLGASIDSISQAVFGDATAKKYHERIAREIAMKKFDQDEILRKYSKILSPEMLIEIKSAMDDGVENDVG